MSVALDAGTDRDRKEAFDREFERTTVEPDPGTPTVHRAELCEVSCMTCTDRTTQDV